MFYEAPNKFFYPFTSTPLPISIYAIYNLSNKKEKRYADRRGIAKAKKKRKEKKSHDCLLILTTAATSHWNGEPGSYDLCSKQVYRLGLNSCCLELRLDDLLSNKRTYQSNNHGSHNSIYNTFFFSSVPKTEEIYVYIYIYLYTHIVTKRAKYGEGVDE